MKVWLIESVLLAVGDGFTYPTLPITEHVRNYVKLGTAVSNFFCVFFKTVLQITAKRAMCLNESITKFMLAQKLRWTGSAPTLFCLGIHVCFFRMFKGCLNFMQHRSTGNIVQFPFETNRYLLFPGETSKFFDKALQMKHCMHV